jgi:hypothetical protein
MSRIARIIAEAVAEAQSPMLALCSNLRTNAQSEKEPNSMTSALQMSGAK